MYMYPITIKRKAQKVRFDEVIELPEMLTIQLLSKYVSNEQFTVSVNEWNDHTLTIYKERLETPEEVKTRVSKEVAYMAEYKKRH